MFSVLACILWTIFFFKWLYSPNRNPNPNRWPVAKAGDVQVGDSVQLLSGGPIMTVTSVSDTGKTVWCAHFVDDKLQKEQCFAVAVLRVKPSTRLAA